MGGLYARISLPQFAPPPGAEAYMLASIGIHDLILLIVIVLQTISSYFVPKKIKEDADKYIDALEERSTATITDCRELIEHLENKLDCYQTAYDHMQYCRHLIGAGTDETLADAIERVTGIKQE
jgi:hypothetical protein